MNSKNVAVTDNIAHSGTPFSSFNHASLMDGKNRKNTKWKQGQVQLHVNPVISL